jgi:type IV secretion system protein TrbE
MHALQIYRSKSKGVSDLLNWAALIDDGTILCKGGEIIGGFFYSCKDTASSTEAERNYLTARVNTALARLDNHWTVTHDAVRMPSSDYPAAHLSYFPDPITRLIEAENREKFLAEGKHFETYYVMILAYTPPLERQSQFRALMYGVDSTNELSLADKHLAHFNKTLDDLADSLNGILTLKRMGS